MQTYFCLALGKHRPINSLIVEFSSKLNFVFYQQSSASIDTVKIFTGHCHHGWRHLWHRPCNSLSLLQPLVTIFSLGKPSQPAEFCGPTRAQSNCICNFTGLVARCKHSFAVALCNLQVLLWLLFLWFSGSCCGCSHDLCVPNWLWLCSQVMALNCNHCWQIMGFFVVTFAYRQFVLLAFVSL